MLLTHGLTVLMLFLGYRQVSAPFVKLQKTLKESLEQPWLGSIQYSPAEGDRETKWEQHLKSVVQLHAHVEKK